MAKQRRRGRRSGSKTSSDKDSTSEASSGGYEAPTAGYEDVLYAHGTTKAAALFGTTNTKLARYVSVQSWSGATIAGKAMEKLADPPLIEPARPDPEEKYEVEVDVEEPDPLDADKIITVKKTVIKSRTKDLSQLKMETDIYMLHYKNWLSEDLNWKTNRSRVYNLVLQHCPPDLEEILKTMKAWSGVSSGYDAIGLLKMLRDVAHDQTESKQTVMGFVEAIAELFTYHQSEKESDDEYGIMFNAYVDSIKAHGGQPWHHPGLAKQHMLAIGRELCRKESDPNNIPASRQDEIRKEAKVKGDKAADNEFLACQFLLGADNSRYKQLKVELGNRFVFGNDDYPKDTTQALALLKNYKGQKKATTNNNSNNNSNNNADDKQGVAFVQQGAARDKSKDDCFVCGKKGHHGHECKSVTAEVRDQHIARRTKDFKDRFQSRDIPKSDTSKTGTQHAAIQEVEEDANSIGSIELESDGMPSRAEFLKSFGYQGMNVGSVPPIDREYESIMEGIGLLNPGSRAKCYPKESHPRKEVTFSSPKAKPRSGRSLKLDDWKLYLDSCATYHSCFADWCLDNVHDVEVYLKGHCNAGVTTCKEQGYYGVFKMWLNRAGIANLLSIPQLENDGYVVDYNTKRDWVVTTPQGKKITFKRDTGLCDRMPYIDLREHQEGVIMIETVRKNFEGYTKRQVKKAILAREAQAMVAHPTDEKFKQMVSHEKLKNCNVRVEHITDAHAIFGHNRSRLKGGTVRQKPDRVDPEYAQIPRDFYRLHKFVTLSADVMFVNGLPFFITRSRDIKLISAEYIPSRTAKQLSSSLTKIVKVYARGGFIVRLVLMDMEFEKIKDEFDHVVVNTTAAREHVSEAEKAIQDVKVRARCVISDLRVAGFMYLHKMIVVHCVYFVVMMINAVPANLGISENFSPREIVTGRKIDMKKDCRALFGAYVEASRDADVTNTMAERTHSCISLGPSGNLQGSLKCFDLITGKVIVRRTFRTIPIPDRILKLVNRWGKTSRSEQYGNKLEFLNRHRAKYDWDNEDIAEIEGIIEPQPSSTAHPGILAEIPGVELEADDEDLNTTTTQLDVAPKPDLATRAAAARANANLAQNPGVDRSKITGVEKKKKKTEVIVIDDDSSDEEDGYDTDDTEAGMPKLFKREYDSDSSDDEDDEDDDVGPQVEEEVELEADSGPLPKTPSYGRGQRVKSQRTHYVPHSTEFVGNNVGHFQGAGALKLAYRGYKYHLKQGVLSMNLKEIPGVEAPQQYADGVIHLNLDQDHQERVMEQGDIDEHIVGLIMAHQYTLKKGIELFGEKAEEATVKELKQIHDMDTYTPLDPKTLTKEEKNKALSALFFLTEKRNGDIKGRKCAVGSKQRTFEGYNKADGSSPTVSTDGLIITCAIDGHENRDVAIVDIPGAFLQAENDEFVLMLLRGKLAEMMIRVDPQLYRKYVITSPRGEPMLYVRLNKALYGLLRSALLFYKKLVGELQEMGFELNPYDPCVANRMVNGHQQTVTWHVDDLKISHKDAAVNTQLIKALAKIYGPKMTVSRGKVHDYLGMDLDYSTAGSVKISMIKYLKNVIDEFPEEITGTAESPAAEHLFKTRTVEEGAKKLPEEQGQAFHHTVAQLLFTGMRARPDTLTVISFLTKRVREPDEDDWGKLKRLLKYLKGTLYLKLTLRVDSMNTISWWVDASYGAHMDLKGHTGMVMSLGRGACMSSSKGQKLNVRSSTEGELVGIDDVMPKMMWGKYFIEAQGYTVDHNICYQDNKSTILLATNGRQSASSRCKHIRHRYFLVKDRIDTGDLEIRHAPTENMWSDVLTKPQQGILFKRMRAEVMNCSENYNDDLERKNTHPKLLPQAAEGIPQESVSLLKKTGVTVSQKLRSGNPEVSSAIKRVTSLSPQERRRSVLSDDQIAQLKKRLERSRSGTSEKARIKRRSDIVRSVRAGIRLHRDSRSHVSGMRQ